MPSRCCVKALGFHLYLLSYVIPAIEDTFIIDDRNCEFAYLLRNIGRKWWVRLATGKQFTFIMSYIIVNGRSL